VKFKGALALKSGKTAVLNATDGSTITDLGGVNTLDLSGNAGALAAGVKGLETLTFRAKDAAVDLGVFKNVAEAKNFNLLSTGAVTGAFAQKSVTTATLTGNTFDIAGFVISADGSVVMGSVDNRATSMKVAGFNAKTLEAYVTGENESYFTAAEKLDTKPTLTKFDAKNSDAKIKITGFAVDSSVQFDALDLNGDFAGAKNAKGFVDTDGKTVTDQDALDGFKFAQDGFDTDDALGGFFKAIQTGMGDGTTLTQAAQALNITVKSIRDASALLNRTSADAVLLRQLHVDVLGGSKEFFKKRIKNNIKADALKTVASVK
jgi:hypothetical protein